MKTLPIIVALFLPAIVFSQETLSMSDVEGRREISMADVSGRSSDGVYRYYAKGATQPFTGVLYSKFANGQFDSWQEYVDGIGQGKWINYYENGNFKEVGNYEQNKVEGPIKKYYLNGQLKAKGTYKDWRVRVGEWMFYDEKGRLVETKDYGLKGSLVEVKDYFERGEISLAWYEQIQANYGL